MARCHFVENCPEAEQICASVKFLSTGLLWGHVGNGADRRTWAGEEQIIGGGLGDGIAATHRFGDPPRCALLGQTEIENFHLAARSNKNIRGFDIAMNDSPRTGGVQRVGQLGTEFEQGIGGHGTPVDTFSQRLTFEQFHDEIRLAIVFADVVDGANARMIQGRRGTGLTLETFERRGVFGEVRSEKFQRDLAAETGVFRPKNLAHASAAQWVNYAVVRNCFADHSLVEIIVNNLWDWCKARSHCS